MSQVRRDDVSGRAAFREIRARVLRALTGQDDVDVDVGALLAARGQVELRRDTALMLDLEGHVVQLLEELGVVGLRALQFPVNVRMLGPAEAAPARPFATDHLHCDLWSGAPPDSFNFFLYLHVSPDSPRLDVFETLPVTHPSASYRGPYAGSPLARSDLVAVPFEAFAGHFVAFPTLTPHQTVRGGDGWRMSVDFRARLSDPYQIDARGDVDSAFSADRMNSLGVYWSFPPRAFARLDDKVAHERAVAQAVGPEAARLRAVYLAKHYPELGAP